MLTFIHKFLLHKTIKKYIKLYKDGFFKSFLLNIYTCIISNFEKPIFSHLLIPITTLHCSFEEKYKYLREKTFSQKSTIFSQQIEEKN